MGDSWQRLFLLMQNTRTPMKLIGSQFRINEMLLFIDWMWHLLPKDVVMLTVIDDFKMGLGRFLENRSMVLAMVTTENFHFLRQSSTESYATKQYWGIPQPLYLVVDPPKELISWCIKQDVGLDEALVWSYVLKATGQNHTVEIFLRSLELKECCFKGSFSAFFAVD